MLRNIILGLSGLILLIVAGAYLVPADVHVERTVAINAPPEAIFPYINDYRAFNQWSPWADRDPDAVYEFSGPPAGIGATISWSGNDQVGSGTQAITASTFPSHLETSLDFGDQGVGTAFFDLDLTDTGTDVTWGFDTDMGMNPIARYMGLMMDGWIGGDYEQGLMNLRDLVEDETSVPRDPDGTPMDPATLQPAAPSGEDDAMADEEKPTSGK